MNDTLPIQGLRRNPASLTPILELRKATKKYAGVPAIEDVDFALLPGEVHAIGLRGNNGQPVFLDSTDREQALMVLQAQAARELVLLGVKTPDKANSARSKSKESPALPEQNRPCLLLADVSKC